MVPFFGLSIPSFFRGYAGYFLARQNAERKKQLHEVGKTMKFHVKGVFFLYVTKAKEPY